MGNDGDTSSRWSVTASVRRLMEVSLAEEKLIERLRMCRAPVLITLFVGGDGEPKELFAQEAQREVLAR